MHAQTPVQIAWVARDLDATESALTTMLGAKKWVRVPDVHFTPDTCTYRGRPADFTAHISFRHPARIDRATERRERVLRVPRHRGSRTAPCLYRGTDSAAFDAAVRDAHHTGTPVVQQGVRPGGMRFAYLSAADSGVPYIEIADIPGEIKQFFDYVKQEQQ